MALILKSNVESLDIVKPLSRSLMKKTSESDSSTFQAPLPSFVMSSPTRMFFVAIISIITILALRPVSRLRSDYPSLKPEELQWSDENFIPGVHDSEFTNAETLANESALLKVSALDPQQGKMLIEIKRLLQPALPGMIHTFIHGNRRNYPVIGTEKAWFRVPPYLLSKDVEPHWPEFQQRLSGWAFARRFEPTVMKSLVAEFKAALDKHYGIQESTDVKYKRCAVVGNSGILLAKLYGGLIDSHDMVMRLNNARTSTYEPYVGKKTTLSFINSNILHSCFRKSNCYCHPYGQQVPLAMYVCQVQHFMDITVCSKKHKSPLLVTSSRFDTLLTRLVKWYSVRRFVESSQRSAWEWSSQYDAESFHYSSGSQAVMLALGICDEVNLFGFGKNESFPHHYHTHQEKELALHDYEAEYRLYDDIANNRLDSIPFLRDSGIELPRLHIYR